MNKYGVNFPDQIDLISHNEDVCNLHIVQSEKLTDDRLFKLQDKLNHYLAFALDGQLEDEFPNLHNMQIRIQLWLQHEPDDEANQHRPYQVRLEDGLKRWHNAR